MVGHNRKATTGAINSENAHPFHEGNIVLVHNGTLRGGHKQLANTEVDSHAVCHSFNEKGAIETIKTLDAAFAFIWWDIEKSKLFAVRNDERPLSMVVTEDAYVLVSEAWMAQALLGREGRKVLEVVDFKPGELYEFGMDGKFTMSTIEIRKAPPVNLTNYGNHAARHNARHAAFMDDDLEDDPLGKTVGPVTTACGGNRIQTPFERASDKLVNPTPFVTNKDYEKGEVVLLKIRETDLSPNGRTVKVAGKIVEPGRATVDFVGYVPTTPEFKMSDVLEHIHEGTIVSFSRSVCGDSAWIRELNMAPEVAIHNSSIPRRIWDYVVENCKCGKCTHEIKNEDVLFTSVSLKPDASYRILCADCIEDQLTTGEVQNAFIQRRLDALQDGQSVSKESPSRALQLVASDGISTLH